LFPLKLIVEQKMSNSKKILITTESHEVFIVRMNGTSNISGFCSVCAEETPLLTLDEAVSLSACHARDLIRQSECGAIHAIETASGHLLICRNSLTDLLKGE
jgi:hypothetical protein